MVFYWSLSDSKSPQLSWTLLSILAEFNNAVVWMVSSHPLISQSSSPSTNPFGDCTECTNYDWYHHHFHVPHFLQLSCKVQVFISLFAFFQFYFVVCQDGKVHYSAGPLFLLIITRSGYLAKIKWSICITKSQGSLCVSFSRMDFGLCIYQLFVWSNLNFLHNSQ